MRGLISQMHVNENFYLKRGIRGVQDQDCPFNQRLRSAYCGHDVLDGTGCGGYRF
jgi:hypothetical protein